MCEFKVVLDGKVVFEEAIYAKDDGEKIVVKDILGDSREFEKCRIVEVDVNNTRLVLSTI